MPQNLSKKQRQIIHTKHHVQRKRIIGLSFVILGLMIAIIIFLVTVSAIQNNARAQRINQIFNSIPIPEKNFHYREDIFAEKRVYVYDASRSSSSLKEFVIASNVDTTFALMDKSIRDAGYTFFDEPYPGSVSRQFHYKTDRGEYIRMSVSSKLRDDAASSEIIMTGKLSDEFFAINANSGPATVTLKVNLDDNNE